MIVFVIIVYNIKLSDCITLTTLRNSLNMKVAMPYRILVLDNSEESSSPVLFRPDFEYIGFRENIGLARAYKYGVAYCRDLGAAFMVTLDQDSTVTTAYIDAVLKYTKLYIGRDVALCPRIFFGDRQISPFSFSPTGIPKYCITGKLHAINSFSVYSVSTLTSSDIIDEFYWLDALDFAIFENLHRRGIPVVAMDVEVQHNLSLLQGGVHHVRLANIAFYEAAFLFEYCGPIRLLSGLFILVLRVARRIDFMSRSNGFGTMLGAIISGAIKGLTRRMGRQSVVGTLE